MAQLGRLLTTVDRLKIARDSVKSQVEQNFFSLTNNPDAQEYFAKYDLSKVKQKVEDDLMSLNALKTGNKLIPYESLNGKSFKVDRIKLLNHRWLMTGCHLSRSGP